ncbi:bleomycin hydrolase, partial [Coemansia brasiliensis]
MQVLSKTASALLTKSLRSFSTHQVLSEAAKRGLVLGMLSNNKLLNADSASLSSAQQQSLIAKAAALGFSGEAGKVQTVLSDDLQQHIALVGLGNAQEAEANKINATETEVVRMAVATGVRQLLQAHKVNSVTIAPMPHAQAAAEGAQLAVYKFDQFKSNEESNDETPANVSVSWLDSTQREWDAGQITARAQNFARDLMNTPANFMTPTLFAERVQREFQGLENVHVRVH